MIEARLAAMDDIASPEIAPLVSLWMQNNFSLPSNVEPYSYTPPFKTRVHHLLRIWNRVLDDGAMLALEAMLCRCGFIVEREMHFKKHMVAMRLKSKGAACCAPSTLSSIIQQNTMPRRPHHLRDHAREYREIAPALESATRRVHNKGYMVIELDVEPQSKRDALVLEATKQRKHASVSISSHATLLCTRMEQGTRTA